MSERENNRIKLMTYNIAGGRQDLQAGIGDLIQVVNEEAPDILGLQEAGELVDADGKQFQAARKIASSLGNFHSVFYPTLSMREHLHLGKKIFIDNLFKDLKNWSLGNALISRWEFTRLSDPTTPGIPANVSLYRPPVYEGTRDTDPRNLILTRIKFGDLNPFLMITHLTTLLGERRGSTPAIKGKTEEAQITRWHQGQLILDMIQDNVIDRGGFAILMADFNAVASEPCISGVLEGQGNFVRLEPIMEIPTHPKASSPIDHILIYSGGRKFEYQCHVVDNPVAHRASDHLPVVATVTLSDE